MSSEGLDIYRELAQHLRRMPIDYPPTESGVEVRLLKHFFTPREAQIALQLGALPEPLKRIYKRVKKAGLDISIEELEQILDNLVLKGSINGGPAYSKRGKKYYGNIMLAIGMHEFSVNRQTVEYVKDFEQYMEEGFYKAFHNKVTPQIRTIPIEKSIAPNKEVSSYNNIRRLIENVEGPIAIFNCVCKQDMDLLGHPCQQTDIRECCIGLRKGAEHFLYLGQAREISKQKLFALLDRMEEDGLVIQPDNCRNPAFICFCCKCCCGVLRSVKRLERPAEYLATNFYATVNRELCKGCKTCMKRCQMDAISIVEKKALVNLDLCIGCGLCVIKCPTGAIQLKEKKKQIVPPRGMIGKFVKLIMKRRGLWGSLKMVINVILRRQV
ncbi:MAG: ATP-binding protein [Candidatus Helarchaeota archaeon]